MNYASVKLHVKRKKKYLNRYFTKRTSKKLSINTWKRCPNLVGIREIENKHQNETSPQTSQN